MSSKIINGRENAKIYLEKIKKKIDNLREKYDITPGLAIVQIGEDKASHVYVNRIVKTCSKAGVNSNIYNLPASTDEKKVVEVLNKLNSDEKTHGIIIQFPIPKNIDSNVVTTNILPSKDVDCINPINIGKMYSGLKGFIPCTPKGALKLLKSIEIDLVGKNAVVVGRSNIVGRPIAELLLKENLTVTICHSKTENLNEYIKNADVVVSAAGKPNLITGDMIKKDAIVIDIGTNVVDGKLVGDVEFEKAKKIASYITPVPGGVGPMTNVMLIENTLEACLIQCGLEL